MSTKMKASHTPKMKINLNYGGGIAAARNTAATNSVGSDSDNNRMKVYTINGS